MGCFIKLQAQPSGCVRLNEASSGAGTDKNRRAAMRAMNVSSCACVRWISGTGTCLDKAQGKVINAGINTKLQVRPVLVSDCWQRGRLAANVQVAA